MAAEQFEHQSGKLTKAVTADEPKALGSGRHTALALSQHVIVALCSARQTLPERMS